MKVGLRIWAMALCLALALAMTGALAESNSGTGKRAANISNECKFKVSEGSRGHLTDNSVNSTWSYNNPEAWIGVQIPAGQTAGYIRVEWLFEPEGFELVEFDAQINPIRTRTLADTFPCINMLLPLMPETKYIQLKMTAMDQKVCTVRIYSEGELDKDIQNWLPPEEKVDMMVFSTHQDDEVIFLGGTIPYSDVVCKRPTITVYMANCTRFRRGEALSCLWAMGSRHYPEFINLTDKRVGSIKEGIELWGGKDNILKELVERIRHYKPEVIVTQDFNGEYGHNQHKILARAMPYAVEAAADPAQYPESYNLYGAWQVKKLYIHLYKENEIRMDWTSPREELNGYTLLKVAQIGMSKHASQTKYYSVKDGGQYDNARFGLYATTVGPDVAKNDFFENIPQDASSAWLRDNPPAAPAQDLIVENLLPNDDAAEQAEANAEEAPAEAAADEQSTPALESEGATDEAAEPVAEAEPIAEAESVPEAESVVEAAAVVEPEADAGAPDADPGPEPTANISRESGGSAWPAVALGAAGVALAGTGGWMLYQRSRRKRYHRRRR